MHRSGFLEHFLTSPSREIANAQLVMADSYRTSWISFISPILELIRVEHACFWYVDPSVVNIPTLTSIILANPKEYLQVSSVNHRLQI